ncbi:MAG: hypothetical protein ACRBCT_05985 [Alphaproteobacteria bacterium]
MASVRQTRELQALLLANGEELPGYGIDGDRGGETNAAIASFLEKHPDSGLSADSPTSEIIAHIQQTMQENWTPEDYARVAALENGRGTTTQNAFILQVTTRAFDIKDPKDDSDITFDGISGPETRRGLEALKERFEEVEHDVTAVFERAAAVEVMPLPPAPIAENFAKSPLGENFISAQKPPEHIFEIFVSSFDPASENTATFIPYFIGHVNGSFADEDLKIALDGFGEIADSTPDKASEMIANAMTDQLELKPEEWQQYRTEINGFFNGGAGLAMVGKNAATIGEAIHTILGEAFGLDAKPTPDAPHVNMALS